MDWLLQHVDVLVVDAKALLVMVCVSGFSGRLGLADLRAIYGLRTI